MNRPIKSTSPNLILLVICVICSFRATGQTYFGGYFGMDASKFSNKIEDSGEKIIGKGFSNFSPVVGARIDQSLANNIFIRIDANFTKKNINTAFVGYLPITNIEFNYFRTRLMLNYSVKKLYFGFGGCYNYKDFTQFTENMIPQKTSTILDHSEVGSAISFGSVFGRFDLELYYFISFTPLFNSSADIDSKPIQSICLTACYNFKIFNKPGGKSLKCPKF